MRQHPPSPDRNQERGPGGEDPDPDLAAITPDHVRGFLAFLATAAPIVNGRVRTIGKKQTLNIHTGLSALWTWALREGYATRHILHDIQRPRPEKPAIIPYSQDDIKRLLTACDQTKTYQRAGQRIQERTRGTALRDRTLILVLLDTGIRASELCGLRIIDADLRNQRITVTGKGSKTRMIPIGPSTAKLIFRYLSAGATNRGSIASTLTLANHTHSTPVLSHSVTNNQVTSGNESATLTHGNTGNETSTLSHSVTQPSDHDISAHSTSNNIPTFFALAFIMRTA